MADRAQEGGDISQAPAAPTQATPGQAAATPSLSPALLHRKGQRRAAGRGALIQRTPQEGYQGAGSWNTGRTSVDSQGHAGRGGAAVPGAMGGGAETVGADAVTRIPLRGLSNVA